MDNQTNQRIRLQYDEIASFQLEELLSHLDNINKKKVYNFKVIDLINEEDLNKPLVGAFFKDLSPNGVYLFYNENNRIRYVGQSKKGFYQRIMTQLDVTFYPNFGWNALLRKLGGERTKLNHNSLSEAEHEFDLNTLKNYFLLMIAVPQNFNSEQIIRLEKYIMKAYNIRDINNGGSLLLNTRIGGLYESDWTKTINELVI